MLERQVEFKDTEDNVHTSEEGYFNSVAKELKGEYKNGSIVINGDELLEVSLKFPYRYDKKPSNIQVKYKNPEDLWTKRTVSYCKLYSPRQFASKLHDKVIPSSLLAAQREKERTERYRIEEEKRREIRAKSVRFRDEVFRYLGQEAPKEEHYEYNDYEIELPGTRLKFTFEGGEMQIKFLKLENMQEFEKFAEFLKTLSKV